MRHLKRIALNNRWHDGHQPTLWQRIRYLLW
jgi:hypothetical protein